MSLTQNVCNNFSHVLCLQPGMSSLTPSSLPGECGGKIWGSANCTRCPLWRRCCWFTLAGGVQAFCWPFLRLMHISLCVCDSALSAPHSAACSINHPSPFFKGKILHLLYYFFTNNDLTYLLNCPLLLEM